MEIVRYISYDSDTGVFTWLKTFGRAISGNPAGKICANGYMRIGFRNKYYLAHRLAFLFIDGRLPCNNLQIDHIDGNRSNNAFVNLRKCTAGENQQNRALSKNNSAGLTGVNFKNGRWRAQIKHKGVNYHIGLYDSPELAYAAYQKRKSEIHTFNPYLRDK